MMQRLSALRDTIDDALRQPVARVYAQCQAYGDGQGLVEYSLLLALLVLVVIGIITLMGNTVSTLWYQRIIDSWPS